MGIDIAIILLYRWLYWNDYTRLEKMSMDGKNRTEIFVYYHYYRSIIAFTLDYQAQQLYWVGVDMDQDPFLSIYRSNVDGTNIEMIFRLHHYLDFSSYYGGFHLSYFEQQLLLSSSYNHEISILEINGQNVTNRTIIDQPFLCNSYGRCYLTIISEKEQLQGMTELMAFMSIYSIHTFSCESLW